MSAPGGEAHGRWTDAAWFAADVDIRREALHLLPIEPGTLADSPFLDTRLAIDWAAAERVAFAHAQGRVPARRPLAWLWHTSFCGSTLLARALDVAPQATVLREPLVLRRLSDARAAGLDIAMAARLCCALLSRPWHAEGHVVLKPTHAALNIAPDLMARGDSAVVLTSSLEDFLVSNLKKSPETQAKAVTLAERALAAGSLRSRLSPGAFNPPDLVSATALQWAAQQELVADLGLALGTPLRIFDAADLFDDLPGVAIDVARCLGLGLADEAIRRRCAAVAPRHAKSTARPYDAGVRMHEKALVLSQHGEAVRRARDWAARHVLPAMRGHPASA